MKRVGDHLAEVARRHGDGIESDLFSRSAFNRYYYSAFLSVRRVLKSLDPAWATPSHQSIPEVLKGEVCNRLKKCIKNAQKNELIAYAKGEEMYRTARTAASELSNLLILARETRRLADYEPETRVSKNGPSMKLGECTMETASHWEGKVDAQSKTILKIYTSLGLI